MANVFPSPIQLNRDGPVVVAELVAEDRFEVGCRDRTAAGARVGAVEVHGDSLSCLPAPGEDRGAWRGLRAEAWRVGSEP